ncbi:palmitoyltransferase hip14 [Anaeramoeba ignava]|uniref:Palmitoyltransferase n=1 Tax=Anaeramoeba ignava TaxID=1746090 RepID=A0A9Q0RA86_ANAIG|nr:palmitoyltransferase hip14 [Anaeramoeba ignava]
MNENTNQNINLNENINLNQNENTNQNENINTNQNENININQNINQNRYYQMEKLHVLSEATKHGNFKLVKEIIESGFDVNTLDSRNATALHWCAAKDSFHIAKILISKGANINTPGGPRKQSPLIWAVVSQAIMFSQVLVNNHANLYQKDSIGLSPIHHSGRHKRLLMCHYLIERGVPYDLLDDSGRTTLHHACGSGSVEIIRYLISLGSSPNTIDSFGRTPLHYAVISGNLEAVKILVQHGAKINIEDKSQKTPIQIAREKRMFYISEFLESVKKELQILQNPFIRSHLKILFGFFPLFTFLIMNLIFSNFPFALSLFSIPLIIYLFLKIGKKYPSKIKGQSPIVFGTVTAMYLIDYLTYFFQVLPTTIKIYPKSTILFIFPNVIMMWMFSILILKDPGFIQQKPLNIEKKITEEIEKNEKRMKKKPETKPKVSISDGNFCATCQSLKPLRSKHDAKSNRCVAKFDHFCPWTLNVVGDKNHIIFIIYEIAMPITQLIFIFFSYLFASSNPEIPKLTFSSIPSFISSIYHYYPWLLSVCLQTLFYFSWEINILYYQIFNILHNITTNERINLKRYQFFWKDGIFLNPFDLGKQNNLLQFFKLKYRVDWYSIFRFEDLPYFNPLILK